MVVAPPSKPSQGPQRKARPSAGTQGSSDPTELAPINRVKRWIQLQTWVIIGLTILLVMILPFAQPTYRYVAIEPDGKTKELVGLKIPNMTEQAVLSWATTSITEVMTMGFGDMDMKIPKQKWRFTADGWTAYNKAFINQKIGETFKKNQLALTTVPSNTPVIVAQGVNKDEIYQWVVQMPVVMTYATNNNVTSKKNGIITLTIVRAPVETNSSGIAIQSWTM